MEAQTNPASLPSYEIGAQDGHLDLSLNVQQRSGISDQKPATTEGQSGIRGSCIDIE